MSNSLITPELIARRGLATLYNSTVLAGLVYRDYDPDFSGAQGDTVQVRTPAVFEASEYDRESGIDVQDISESSTPVVLDKVADVSFAVTSEELTLDIDNFAERVMAPAMEAIAQKVDADIADALQGVSTTPVSGSSSSEWVINARTALSENKVPTLDRYGVWSPWATGELLKDPLFISAEKRGDTDGLIEASVGRKLGLDNYESQNIGSVAGVAFHRSGVALVSRTLALPLGKTGDQAAVANYKGLGVRVVRDYDISAKQDIVSVDFCYGVKVLDENRIVPVTD